MFTGVHAPAEIQMTGLSLIPVGSKKSPFPKMPYPGGVLNRRWREIFFDAKTYKTPEVLKCEIKWTFKDITLYNEFLQKGVCLSTKEFYNPKCNSIKWKLHYYPQVNDESATIALAPIITLANVDKNGHDCKIKAKFTIYAIDTYDKKVVICSTSVDFRNMIKSDEFPIDMAKCLHVEDDSLHLCCVVEYIPILYEKEMEFFNDLDKNHKASDMSANEVKKSLTKMFKQGTLADFVIKVGDKELKTHRCVLANNSVVFKGMFKSNMLEAQTGELKIKDFSYDCVIAMIEFFYSGEINEDTFEELGEDLFAIAHKYEVESLKEECERRMGSSINPTNFNKRYQCAKTYGLPMLEKACVKFIADNKKQFLFSEEWEKFESDNNKTACEMVKIAFCGEFSSDEN